MKLPSVGGSRRPASRPAEPPAAARLSGLRRLLAGGLPLSDIFIWRMLFAGSVVNLIAMVAGLVLFSLDVPTLLAAAVYFAPIPYNVLLLAGVWRSAAREQSALAGIARIGSLIWFVLMLVL